MYHSILSAGSLTGKRILVRAELNVPIKDGTVENRYRLNAALETLSYLHEHGARTLVIAHLGRDPRESLEPVARALQETLPLRFLRSFEGPEIDVALENMEEGDTVLFENLRANPGEEANDPAFARLLASLGDIYVNDAFAASHRTHTSIVGVPALMPSFAGVSFDREVKELSRALEPRSPSLIILGGAKFETKLPLLRAALYRYDMVFVGGAIAHDIFRAKGYEIGSSLQSKDTEGIEEIMQSNKVLLPIDVSVTGPSGTRVCLPEEVRAEETIVDAGPETITMLGSRILDAALVIWNGPLGNYEKGFSAQTESVAELVADSAALSFVGGGDTVASIERLGLGEAFTFVSTAGGAMLDFLVDGKLPGIEALEQATARELIPNP